MPGTYGALGAAKGGSVQWWGNTERILFFIKTKISRGRLGTLLDFLLMLLSFTIIFILKYKVGRHNNLF